MLINKQTNKQKVTGKFKYFFLKQLLHLSLDFLKWNNFLVVISLSALSLLVVNLLLYDLFLEFMMRLFEHIISYLFCVF